VSFWLSQIGDMPRRAALNENISVDIVLVGAGFTNLWVAYYLIRQKPELKIAILEREAAGFGASGRNGGFVSHSLPGQRRRYAKLHGIESVIRFQHAMFDTIDEIIRVTESEGIEADLIKNGEAVIATNPAQLRRIREEYTTDKRWGFGGEDHQIVEGSGVKEYPHIDGAAGVLWSPHCARVQPAKLASGLAQVVERLGVRIFENTFVTDIVAHAASTEAGYTASATYVVRGTEGYTPSLRGQRRDWLPKLSSMIVTVPLEKSTLRRIGWGNAVMLRDAAHSFCFIQKTADDRIALGGPGVPYYFGSRTDSMGRTPLRSEDALVAALHRLFPELRRTEVDHTWTGVLGVPRDWCSTVNINRETGICIVGGYVGDGVSSSNLAGRTLRDLLLGNDSNLTRLPWVGKQIRKWEPEPLRWIALRGLYGIYTQADRFEANSANGRTSVLARFANVISGRH
jgi:glycine/D-amino acid oxidase-like deaminating enzyme